MSNQEPIIHIKIFDRSYPIKCPSEEAAQLQESAKYLDQKMRELKQSGSTYNSELLAIVAALNVCHELMLYQRQKNQSIDRLNDQIKTLQQRIQKFLNLKESVTV